jgi:hypothetical protein
MWARSLCVGLTVLAFMLSVSTGYRLWTGSFIGSDTGTVTGPDGSMRRATVLVRQSFSETFRRGVPFIVAWPTLALLATFAAWRGRLAWLMAATVLFYGLAFVAGFSIGSDYLPAAWCLVAAAAIQISTTLSRWRKQVRP